MAMGGLSTRQLLSIQEQLNSQPLERGSKAPMAELPSCYRERNPAVSAMSYHRRETET